MNLKESIRRILREESKIPKVIARRVSLDELDKIFERSLDVNTEDYENPLTIMYGRSYKAFAKVVIDDMIVELQGELGIPYLDDEDEYNEKYREPLLRRYAPIIKDRYMDITSNSVDESVLKEETEIPLFVRRRFTLEDLEWLVNDVKELIDYGESLDTAIYDGVREFIKSRKFSDIDEFGLEAAYWESYLKYEKPLVRYVKNRLNIQESVLQEETSPIARRIFRRADQKKLDKIFVDGLGIMTTRYLQNQHNWHDMTFNKFKQTIISYLIVDMCTKYTDICFGTEDFYDRVWEFMSNYYSDRIEERWEEIKPK